MKRKPLREIGAAFIFNPKWDVLMDEVGQGENVAVDQNGEGVEFVRPGADSSSLRFDVQGVKRYMGAREPCWMSTKIPAVILTMLI